MKKVFLVFCSAMFLILMCGCDYDSYSQDGTAQNIQDTQAAVGNLTASQPTPTDIDYSLERYNLIKRAYWVNGQREKAMSYPCAVGTFLFGVFCVGYDYCIWNYNCNLRHSGVYFLHDFWDSIQVVFRSNSCRNFVCGLCD